MLELIKSKLDSGYISEADYILTAIEKAGMIPPVRSRTSLEPLGEDGCWTYGVRKWEEE